MSLAQLRGHGGFVVEIGKAAIRVESAGVEDDLGRLLDFSLLRVRGRGPGEVVIDDTARITVSHFEPTGNRSDPSHMYIRC